ncbi:hypothetical protein GCM10022295_22640 [Streptomyces osmaniensis]|uniref:Transposase n=1 Tax=Streptomyces osmaniensis TaxID=593134 RepID=A0ABP6VVZ0_9ACTN
MGLDPLTKKKIYLSEQAATLRQAEKAPAAPQEGRVTRVSFRCGFSKLENLTPKTGQKAPPKGPRSRGTGRPSSFGLELLRGE